MGWFSGLFGGGDTAGKAIDAATGVLDGIGGWIDGKDFTEQEKSEALGRAVDAHLELVKATNSENSVRSITRRIMAWGIVAFTLFWGSVAMGFAIAGKEKIVNDMVSVMTAFNLGMAFVAVVGLYFGVQFLRK